MGRYNNKSKIILDNRYTKRLFNHYSVDGKLKEVGIRQQKS